MAKEEIDLRNARVCERGAREALGEKSCTRDAGSALVITWEGRGGRRFYSMYAACACMHSVYACVRMCVYIYIHPFLRPMAGSLRNDYVRDIEARFETSFK